MTKGFYQHDDEVIEAARVLKQALLADSPLGNELEAQRWVRENYPQVVALAAQSTEDEERRTGWVQPRNGAAYPAAI